MTFELFDPKSDFRISYGDLPHWYQPGVTYFITFRTDDSIPPEVGALWLRRRNDWLQRHRINPYVGRWQAAVAELLESQQQEFHATFSQDFMEYLGKGYGACVLKQKACAQIVADSLKHFHGERYDLADFVIMPNHVHLLVGLYNDVEVEDQCFSWKKFTATKLNRELGTKGRFWQEESFDHLVRSPEQFDYLRRYIAQNALDAGVSKQEPFHYQIAAFRD